MIVYTYNLSVKADRCSRDSIKTNTIKTYIGNRRGSSTTIL